ncbi:Delta-aminolevulinic acid dehydratase [Neolecta irregularis DAH-3]|uniref:Delta-aminolevulinic acid dehydratase n=1 Tax=Neolecta irregularis (strain DAH-3) TaxID=1198029 RepID=A0A1U7LP56_NEOID|nr:Delta-aminolevulinic acid dehydratase [Neolecta irregularis DAH-3]|eukprot:OLL24419.1 Delta-aminolevulinic acid dehydratase [Neolecta irregularis DAH-3]
MYPIFVTDSSPDAEEVIQSMPNQKRWGLNKLKGFLAPLIDKGLHSIILFGIPSKKDEKGGMADHPDTPVIQAIKLVKKSFPGLFVAADVCLCEYTSHGHCGILNEDGTLKNIESVIRITEVAVAYAKAGADCVAPSDMMDGRIKAIKTALIKEGLANKCLLMAYAAKFSTCLYGPFRDAAGSAPSFGDRKCYQLPPNARGLARRAIKRDLNEGADIIMVKPATFYHDIIAEARELAGDIPIACYQVSGEFAMIHAAAKASVFDLRTGATEAVGACLRAGCSLVLSYFTPEFLDWLST